MMTLSISGLKPEIQVLRHCIPHHRPDNDTTQVLSGAVTGNHIELGQYGTPRSQL